MPVIKFTELGEERKSGERVDYCSPNDLRNLLQYIFNTSSTFEDTVRRKNYLCQGPYCGCEPFFFPREYETDPEMVFEAMMFTVHAFPRTETIPLVRHRIISFTASDYLLPQDLDALGRELVLFYAEQGYIAAYGIHANKYFVHIHIAVCNVSYQTGNQMQLSYEYNRLMTICVGFQNRFEEGLFGNPMLAERQEEILFGKPQYTARVGLSAKQQIEDNARGKRG